MQGKFQAAGLFVSLAIALVGGIIVGELGVSGPEKVGPLRVGDPPARTRDQPGGPRNPVRLWLWDWVGLGVGGGVSHLWERAG